MLGKGSITTVVRRFRAARGARRAEQEAGGEVVSRGELVLGGHVGAQERTEAAKYGDGDVVAHAHAHAAHIGREGLGNNHLV